MVQVLRRYSSTSRKSAFFDIQGKFTGLLFSRALTSPCGKIRIPINEDRGETGQIVAYLKKYNGEGIQHIAVGTENIYDSRPMRLPRTGAQASCLARTKPITTCLMTG